MASCLVVFLDIIEVRLLRGTSARSSWGAHRSWLKGGWMVRGKENAEWAEFCLSIFINNLSASLRLSLSLLVAFSLERGSAAQGNVGIAFRITLSFR